MPTTGLNRQRGHQGEALAAAFLTARGYQELARNLEIGRLGEIDLLMQDGDELVLVEVKAQSAALANFDPTDKFDFQKRRKLAQLAQAVAARYPDHDIRVDLVAIHSLNQQPVIRHYSNLITQEL